MKTFRKKLTRILIVVTGATATVWLSGARLFAFPGESMAPAIMPGDHFVGMVGLWNLRAPKRFDMVLFDVPASSKWAERKIPWMKRVVGLPGERVRLSGVQLFINGERVDAPFLHLVHAANPKNDFEVTLQRDEFFVLGDNLDHSFDDSRSMGPISRVLLKGFVACVIQ